MAFPSDLARDAVDVAPTLLGGTVTSRIGGELVVVRIAEVEAYHGLGTGDVHDAGSHARMGPTARNATMWGPPGRLYVYLNYGMHHALNVACSPDGSASGVLLRAGEVVGGAEVARRRRGDRVADRDLARGPGRLAQALGVDSRAFDGIDLADRDAEIVLDAPEAAPAAVRSGPRVGVSGEAGGPAFPWRFWLDRDAFVSAYRPGRGVPAG